MQRLFIHPGSTVKYIYHSILYLDYNALIPLFLILPLKILGYSFTHYVLYNFLFFLVPVWWILLSIFEKVIKVNSPKSFFYMCPVITCFGSLVLLVTFNPFYMAMFFGYAGVACLIPAALSLLLFIDYDPLSLTRKQIIRDVLISALLLLTFLLRRYFAYFIVGYGTTLVIYSIYVVIEARRTYSWRKAIWHSVLNLTIIGSSALLVLVLFFRPLLIHVLFNNYAGQYSAYDTSLVNKINQVINKFGLFTFIMAGISVLLSLINRKYRKVTMFCAISSIVTAGSFFHVQSMGIHHIYTIALELVILMFLGIYQLMSTVSSSRGKIVVGGTIELILLFGFINCFFPQSHMFFRPVEKFFSQTYTPLRRNDISELHRLADYLNSLTIGTNNHVYIAASGGILNSSLMGALDKPFHDNAVHNMYRTHDVDLRDGFPAEFLKAKYIVVSDPIQLHLAPGSQEVVRFLAQEVMKQNSPIGRHFDKLDEVFHLDNSVKAYIYVKQSDFEEDDLLYLVDYFSKCYPNKNSMFRDRILE